MIETRDKRLDIIKGITILFVVIGHNIQLLKGVEYAEGLFFENTIFSLIYSFHMPIFMLISGYLFHRTSNNYTTKTIILKRIKTLIVPIVFWTLLITLLYIVFDGATFSFSNFVIDVLNALWFLWAVFYSTLGLIVGKKFFNDNVLFHIAVILMLMITPNVFNKDLYAFMYPYFITGYYAKKYEFNTKKINILGVLFAYLVLFFFWDTDKYIYTTGLSLLGEAGPVSIFLIDMYRWAMGILGSIIIIKITDTLYNKFKNGFSVLTYLGKNSLGIYIVNIYLANHILLNITMFESWDIFSYTLICIVLSALVTGICLLVVEIIKKSKVLNSLLLGGGFRTKANRGKTSIEKSVL